MNTAHRLSLSLPVKLAAEIRSEAKRRGVPISAWAAEAMESRLLLDRARAAIADYEAEHGQITAEELRMMSAAWPE